MPGHQQAMRKEREKTSSHCPPTGRSWTMPRMKPRPLFSNYFFFAFLLYMLHSHAQKRGWPSEVEPVCGPNNVSSTRKIALLSVRIPSDTCSLPGVRLYLLA